MKKFKKSPFPGMDPYLERRWGDVHTSFCIGIRTALQPNLPAGLRARAQEDVLLENDDQDSAFFEPELAGSISVAAKPIAIRHLQRPKRRRWVEILDASDSNRVVTAIEVLSPGKKEAGKLNRAYREKLMHYIDAGANVVEIDLLRSSRKRLAVPRDEIPEDRWADYYTAVCRAADPTLWLVYPMPLRSALPVIQIPCREHDDDVPLALQPIIDQIYFEGAHDDLDYSQPPEPPFSPADAEWAASLMVKRTAAAS